jgi:uncharacterized protein (TIGR03435 family)
MTPRSFLILVSCSLIMGTILVRSPLAQTTAAATMDVSAYTPTITFDVASVRQSKVDPERGITVSGGFTPQNSSHLRLTNFDIHNLLSVAYGVDWNAVEGIPKELADFYVVFNVEAESDEAADRKLAALPKDELRLEQQHMMQALLADRFALKAHWETRQGETCDLIVSKRGKLVSTGAPPSASELKAFGNRPIPSLYQMGGSNRGFEFIAHGATIDELAETLTGQFGLPVRNKTGLTGKYDFDLKYYQIREQDRRENETNPWSPLDFAIQDQLGLKVVPSTGSIRILVIDHIERPSAN